MLQIYMGEGKGKTTAAVGLTVRAAGQNMRVLFAQFMKGGASGELNILRQLPQVTVMRSEIDFPFFSKMTNMQKQEQTQIHNAMLDEIEKLLAKEKYDVIILDEVTYPCRFGLIDEAHLKRLITGNSGNVEFVCTGRNPQEWMLLQADYITNMRADRHPYEQGIQARRGIEF